MGRGVEGPGVHRSGRREEQLLTICIGGPLVFLPTGWLRRCKQPNHRCSLLETPGDCWALLGQGQGSPGGRGSSCYQEGLGSGSTMPPPSSECPRQEQDIVFLVDGSGSIHSRDFAKMLSFVKAVMSQFQRPRTQVHPWGRAGTGQACRGTMGLWGGRWVLGRVVPAPALLPVLPDAVLQHLLGSLHV